MPKGNKNICDSCLVQEILADAAVDYKPRLFPDFALFLLNNVQQLRKKKGGLWLFCP